MRKNKEVVQSVPLRVMSGVVLGALASLLLCVLVLLAAAMGMSSGAIGAGMEYRVTLLACVVSVLIGGLVAIKRYRSFLMGIGTGIAFYLCLLTIGVLFYEVQPMEQGGMGILFASLVGGCLAGILGDRRPKKKRRRG